MTPTPFAPIAKILGTSIRMLSSEHPGERDAAAQAIRRILARQKLDFHSLADVIEGAGEKKYSDEHLTEIYQRGIQKGRQLEQAAHPRSNGGFHSVDIEPSKWLEMAQECSAHRRKRTEQEEQFVEDMVARAERGQDLTEKQGAWLKSIYGRRPI